MYYHSTTDEIVYEGVATIEAINISNFGSTSKLISIPYASNQQITTSNFVATLDNFLDSSTGSQTYTFGPSVQARFIAGGTNAVTAAAPTATIYYSADGNNWIASPYTGFNAIGGVVNGLAYNGILWVAVGTSASTTPATTVIYSYDGISWTAASGTTFGSTTGAQGRDVAWGGNKFVAVGTSGGAAPATTAIYSYDGINWLATTTTGSTTGMWSTTSFSGSGWGVAYNGSRWVAVGGDGNTTAATANKCIYYSADGLTWTNATGGSPFVPGAGQANSIARSICWNGLRWVAVGTNNTSTVTSVATTSVFYSNDNGVTWTATATNVYGAGLLANQANYGGYSIAFNGVRMVTVGGSAQT